MNIGESIKINRKKLSLTQDELAEKIHVSRQTISSWENLKSLPDITSLILLSDVYEVSLDELIKGDISMVKKLEFKKSKVKFKEKIIPNLIINLLLLVIVFILGFTGYKNDIVYYIIIILFWLNLHAIPSEFKEYKDISKKMDKIKE
ncbi:hypothetical protein CBF29_10970 [Vagococcus elongatus]|uniref:HTH cro/C1-type domain-containing protein n=1 Tax=Vagococcus elongatus TaxID=180344 RepID=A0A430ANJ2_9ENTE|nr:hypothetical protein CBF29_10970 [Vagococcus elongatus]